jgi:hypothetical protein
LGVPVAFTDEPVYPDDAFSRPLEDKRPAFETLDGVGPFLAVDDRAAHFSDQDFRLAVTDGRTRARWRFRSRGLDHNVLMVSERIRRAPRAIALRVVNRSPAPISVGLEAHELGWLPVAEHTGAAWTIGESQAVAAGQDRVLTYPLAQARAPGRERVRYPLGALLLKLAGVKPDVPYELLLSDLVVYYDPAPGARVLSLTAELADSRARLTVAAEVPSGASPVDIEARRDDHVLWRIRLTPEERARLSTGSCAIERELPWWVPAGPLAAGMVLDGRRLSGPEAALRVARRPSAQLPRVERKAHGGRPAVFIDGRPFNWRGYSSYEYVPGSVAEFGASGVNVFCVPTCAGRHMYQVAAPTLPAHGRADYGELDERVCFSLQANPDAYVTLRVALAMPPWWTHIHEDELARVDAARGVLIWEEFAHTRVASLASRRWIADQSAALRDLIRHCKAQPWASRLIGIWLMGETTEEWFAWGSNERYFSDYSPPMAEAFRRTTAGGALPTRQQRTAPGWDVYPDTPDGRLAAAYHGFLSDLTTRVVGQFARVVKEETSGRTLACCFLGYVVQLAGEPRQALSGHFGLRRALDDPNIDMIAGVPLHDFRDLANGYNPYCSATESILASGKLVCDENDLFSWLHNSLWHRPYDPADPRGAAISMHERECANDAVHGTIQQKFSLAASWHHDAALQRAFAHQARVYRDAMDGDRSGAEEIAFLVDDTSFAWTPPETTLLAIANKHVLMGLGRTGAAVGVWLLSDIEKLPSRIKMVVVASSYAARSADIAKLERAIARGGRTIWVIGAPGLVHVEKGAWSSDRPGKVLGLPIRQKMEGGSGVAVLTAENRGVPSLARLRPRPEADGPGWLRYDDGPTAGIERALPDSGRLIWSGVPIVDSALFRRWIEDAGVHCHAPVGCFVHAARSLVAITAPAAGAYRLRWPRAVVAVDMLDGMRAEGTEFECPFRLGQTRLFRLAEP